MGEYYSNCFLFSSLDQSYNNREEIGLERILGKRFLLIENKFFQGKIYKEFAYDIQRELFEILVNNLKQKN